MVFNYKIVQDGHTYEAGEDVPDMGTIKCVSVKGNIRDYEGMSYDLDKLKAISLTEKYNDLGTGSSLLLYDTGKVYKYEATLRLWSELGK